MGIGETNDPWHLSLIGRMALQSALPCKLAAPPKATACINILLGSNLKFIVWHHHKGGTTSSQGFEKLLNMTAVEMLHDFLFQTPGRSVVYSLWLVRMNAETDPKEDLSLRNKSFCDVNFSLFESKAQTDIHKSYKIIIIIKQKKKANKYPTYWM